MNNTARDHREKFVVSYLLTILIVMLLVQTLYSEYISTLMRLILTEDYSYLLAAVLAVGISFHLSLRHTRFEREIRLGKLISSILLAMMSAVTYLSSELNAECSTHLAGLSLAIAVISILNLTLKSLTPLGLTILLLPLVTVPIPTTAFDRLTVALSRTIGAVVSTITSSSLLTTLGSTGIKVDAGNSSHIIYVEGTRIGVYVLSSAVLVLPVIAYFFSINHNRPLRKALIASLAVLLSTLIGLLGNIARVASAVYIARHISTNVASLVLYSFPSILYSLASIIVSYLLMSKFAGSSRSATRETVDARSPAPMSGGSIRLLVIILLIVSSVLATTTTLRMSRLKPVGDVEVESLDDLPNRVVKAKLLLDYKSEPLLAQMIGSAATYRATLAFNGSIYYGLIEFVDTPARLHTLQLLLSLEGHRVLYSWTGQLNGVDINFIISDDGDSKYSLVYTLFPINVRVNESLQLLYTRISLVGAYSSPGDILSLTNALLSALAVNVRGIYPSGVELLNVLGLVASVLFIVLLIYVPTTCLFNLVQSKRLGASRNGRSRIR